MIRERSYCLDRLLLCSLCVSIPAGIASIGSAIGGAGSAIGGALGIGGAGLAASAIPDAIAITPELAGLGSAAAGASGLAGLAGTAIGTGDLISGAGAVSGLSGIAGGLGAPVTSSLISGADATAGLSGIAGGLGSPLVSSGGGGLLGGLGQYLQPVASLLGSAGQAYGSTQAASIEAAAAKYAADNQMKMYQQTRSDLAPYMSGGANAFSTLSNLMGMGGPAASANMLAGLQNYPGYQFALQQGQTGLDRTAAAKGLLLSGGQLKDTVNYNQGMATNLFGQYFNQLSGMSQLGANAAAGVGTQGQNAAATAGQDRMLGAGATAQGINNAGNSLSSALNNALQGYAMQNGGFGSGSFGNGYYIS